MALVRIFKMFAAQSQLGALNLPQTANDVANGDAQSSACTEANPLML